MKMGEERKGWDRIRMAKLGREESVRKEGDKRKIRKPKEEKMSCQRNDEQGKLRWWRRGRWDDKGDKGRVS